MAEARLALEQIKALFHQDFLPEAYLALREFGTVHTESRFGESLDDVDEVRELKKDVECANRSLELLADFDSWDLVREEDDIAIFSKGSSNEFIIRSEMLMSHSPFSLLAIFAEVDLLSTWCALRRIDVIAESREVYRPSVFRRVNHFVMKLPWPLSNRDLLLSCTGVPMPQNKSVLLIIQDLQQQSSYLGYELQPPAAGIVRILMHNCCINLMQLAPDKTQVSFLSRADPRISLLPAAVRNWGAKQAIFKFMQQIREQCAHFPGSEYERRVEKNPEFYNTLKERASKYHFENVQ